MNKLLYPKLALVNIKKHGKLYLPYIISAAFTSAMFYVMCEITFNEGIEKIYGAQYMTVVMGMGDFVIGVFALIFLLYTNSFLMKQRKTELGLYNVLGMEKKHISKIMGFESLFVGAMSIASGLFIGILFDKLVTMFLCKLLHSEINLGFTVSPLAIVLTCVLMLGIFFISYISNIVRIKHSKTIELLQGGKTGEKEPRTKLILAIVGAAMLAWAYFMAVSVQSPIEAINVFFFAVLAVIAATYCLFIAGSVVVLKLLRKKKSYYYNPSHFTTVSGMLYRMKQNAVGLANICILSTMVLVMVSTTVALYAGTEDSLKSRYPQAICTEMQYAYKEFRFSAERSPEISKTVEESVLKTVKDAGLNAENISAYKYLGFATIREGDEYKTDADNFSVGTDVHELCFVSAADYSSITGKSISLGANEVMVCDYGEKSGDTLKLLGKSFKVKEHFEEFPDLSNFASVIRNVHYIIVADDYVLEELNYKQLEAFGEKKASNVYLSMNLDLDGTEAQRIACSKAIDNNTEAALKAIDAKVSFSSFSRDAYRGEFYSNFGSFFFLGIVLGLLFLMITVMIIYYKQISEGYDDKKRFEIMQQVGMSHAEVKKTIRSQVLTVFFLPLVTAFIHLAFAFPIISRLLVVFSLTNTAVFAIALLVTAVVFAAIYTGVYMITARAYYKIVS